MAVKDFIPVKDFKQTVEKEVKQKPTLAELTTIESPGRPIPADRLEETSSEKLPKKIKTRKTTSDPTKIERPNTNTILVITEKPQAAQKIAFALGRARKYTDRGVSYFEVARDNKTILIASAVGHLFGLTYKQGQQGWPIFELEWRPSYEKDTSAFTKKYFDLLKKLARRTSEIVIATDYDNEGEVIGWNVLRFICHQTSARRMKFSTLTKLELEHAYENPLPTPAWGQAYAGEARHILDWLYGINLSRALMASLKTIGSFKILSIGRVQGPTLKIIVDKEREIENFKPEPFWQVFALVNNFEYKHPEDLFDKNDLEKFRDIKEGIAVTKDSEENILPPHPFDLTTLQREVYRLYKINPSQTLAIAQRLYLDSLISYPRTSSQKIPSSIEPKKILKALERHYEEVKYAIRKKPIEGKKSDPAHPSIYPTGEYGKLKEPDQRVYDLIVKRFIALFSPDAKVTNRKTIITAKNNPELTFRASGLKILEKGWALVYPTVFEEKDIPELQGSIAIDEIKIVEKETQPPKRYTPASLITTLEKKNLGTKTTRSMIIDTLFERGYLDGTSIKATSLGLRLVESLETYSPIIIDENLTRQLEDELEKIQLATTDYEKKEQEVIEKAKRLIRDIAKEFKVHEREIGKHILSGIEHLREEQRNNLTIMPCPTCKVGNLRILYSKKTNRSFIACSNYPNCTQTYSLPPNALIKRSEKQCSVCTFPTLLAIRRGRRPWEFCFNQNCPRVKQQREAYLARKNLSNG